MADFVYCNSCFALPDQNSKFFLTACDHILCERCKERATEQCTVCKKKCSIVEIGRGMHPSMETMFSDPATLAKKQHRDMAQALGFQKMHRSRYISFLQQQLKKAKKLHEYATNETKKRQHAEKENQKLKEDIVQLKQEVAQLKHHMRSSGSQTPLMPSDPSMRYRASRLPDNTMTVSSSRTNLTVESGSSLPVGVEAANFQPNRGTVPLTPFLDASMSSPRMEFGGFDVNMSRDSMNNTVVGGGGRMQFNPMWQNEVSSMSLGPASTTQSTTRPINTSYNMGMNNLTHAFRRAL